MDDSITEKERKSTRVSLKVLRTNKLTDELFNHTKNKKLPQTYIELAYTTKTGRKQLSTHISKPTKVPIWNSVHQFQMYDDHDSLQLDLYILLFDATEALHVGKMIISVEDCKMIEKEQVWFPFTICGDFGKQVSIQVLLSFTFETDSYNASGNKLLFSSEPKTIELAFDNDMTVIFEEYLNLFEKDEENNLFRSIEGVSDTIICYVPGLFSGKLPGAGNKNNTLKRMEQLMKDGCPHACIIDVLPDGQVEVNAAIIATFIKSLFKEKQKKTLLVGHSKGGIDITAAVALFPDIHKLIRGVITLSTPYHGSHMAESVHKRRASTAIVNVMLKRVMKCDPIAMKQLSITDRKLFIKEHPFPDNVPVLSFVTTAAGCPDKQFSSSYKYLRNRYKQENDGLVLCKDAIVPNAKVVYLKGVNHHGPRPQCLKYKSKYLALQALIATTLVV